MSERPPTVLVAVDAGDEVGWGHFVRSAALAEELRRRGCRVDLRVNGPLPPFASNAAAETTDRPRGFVPIPDGPSNPDLVLLDLFEYSPTTASVVPASSLIAAVVDSSELPFAADVEIDPNVCGLSLPGRLSGARAVMLRPEFDPMPVLPSGRGRTLAVSFGGAPPPALVATALAAAEQQDGFGDVRFILPPRLVPVAAGTNVFFAPPVENMAAFFRNCAAGLFAAGTLMHEACACGLPAAIVSFTDDQRREAEAVAAAGAIIYLGDASEVDTAAVGGAFAALCDASLRGRLSEQALALGFGEGRARVADALLSRVVESLGA